MVKAKRSAKSDGWTLFDTVVAEAPARQTSPWVRGVDGESPSYVADYDTLELLLRVPAMLGASSTSGIPALALDVWLAYELRRAGFDPDAVWPRADTPRILPGPIAGLLAGLPKADARRLRELLASGNTFGGTVGASAKVLGKHYMKQVDVVMSDWNTGPELLVSTKRMDDSFGNNAPNRIEESYGDAKNLRSRHPQAALGFVFCLRSTAFTDAPRVADWIIDLLAKLGREDDAYDSVALIVPSYDGPSEDGADADEAAETAAAAGLLPSPEFEPVSAEPLVALSLYERLLAHPPVRFLTEKVPAELDPNRFLARTVHHVLDHSPITRHGEARGLLGAVE